MTKVVVVTGGFDPLHVGHIEYINAARQLGDKLVVGVNSDAWLTRKKGRPFMSSQDRISIIQNLKAVSDVFLFDDNDDTAIEAIRNARLIDTNSQIVFANGGDRTKDNIPEQEAFKDDPTVEFAFSVGGDTKLNSSSWILEEWKSPKTDRDWGYYRVLHDVPGTKVKELTVEPGQELSMQRHFCRQESWHIASGSCRVYFEDNSTEWFKELHKHDSYLVPLERWHKITNPFNEPCHIIEIQYGTECDEVDIERR
jgi:D-beta-D-heptose 7-phosphate kinase/D-beta-D-heptose 1-phosphate adenosyltransferase